MHLTLGGKSRSAVYRAGEPGPKKKFRKIERMKRRNFLETETALRLCMHLKGKNVAPKGKILNKENSRWGPNLPPGI